VLVSALWAFVFTYGMLWPINHFTPVKVDPSVEDRMDDALHGEEAHLQ
jgi:ammonium transporter, Amt family